MLAKIDDALEVLFRCPVEGPGCEADIKQPNGHKYHCQIVKLGTHHKCNGQGSLADLPDQGPTCMSMSRRNGEDETALFLSSKGND